MAGTSKTTTDHDEIRKWLEERGVHPAIVESTSGADDPGLLRIDFPCYSGKQSLNEISWDEFFKKIDEKKLTFPHQDEKADGEQSRFGKFLWRVD